MKNRLKSSDKINNRILLLYNLFLLIISVISAIIALNNNNRFRDNILKQWTTQLQTTTSISAINIENFLEKFSENLITISNNPVIIEKTLTGKSEIEGKIFCPISTLYQVHQKDVKAIFLFDKDNQFIMGYPSNLTQNYPAHLIKEVSRKAGIIDSGETNISPATYDINRNVVITITASVRKGSKITGYVMWVINMDKIAEKNINPFLNQKLGYLWVIDQNKNILVHHDPNYLGLNSHFILQDFLITRKVAGYSIKKSKKYLEQSRIFFNKIERTEKGSGFYIDFSHSEYSLAVFNKIMVTKLGWTIIMSTPTKSMLEPVRQNAIRNYSLTSIIIFLIAGISIFTFRIQQKSINLKKETEYLSEIAKSEKKLKEEREKRLTATIEGQETERNRIAREIHDGLGQFLLSIKVKAESLTINDENSSQIEDLKALLIKTIDETKRISNDVMPLELEELGLSVSIQNLIRKFTHSLPIKADYVEYGIPSQIDGKITTYLYRITQEAISNIIKYSKATEANIQLLGNSDQITLIIQDNGIGFDPLEKYKGNGISNMSERVKILGGFFEIESNAGEGCHITIKIPLKQTHA